MFILYSINTPQRRGGKRKEARDHYVGDVLFLLNYRRQGRKFASEAQTRQVARVLILAGGLAFEVVVSCHC